MTSTPTRIHFTDPAPLPPGAPEYVDDQSRRDYARQQIAARSRMAMFDAQPYALRRVWDTFGGSLDVAMRRLSFITNSGAALSTSGARTARPHLPNRADPDVVRSAAWAKPDGLKSVAVKVGNAHG